MLNNKTFGFVINDIENMRKKKLRDIYSSKTLHEHDIFELDDARGSLLRYKGEGMQRWDWKYTEVLRYLYKGLARNKGLVMDERDEDRKALFDVLQESYKIILMNDDTEDLENLHLALVEALHEWAFKYCCDATKYKILNDAAWTKVIEYIANKLVDEVNDYQERNAKSAASSMSV